MERWTGRLYRDYAALHHWDLPFGSTTYRVFLLPGGLEPRELRRALGAAGTELLIELERTDPSLAARLRSVLAEFAIASVDD